MIDCTVPKIALQPGHEYHCLTCKHQWRGPAGPATCPVCDGNFVSWVSYTAPAA